MPTIAWATDLHFDCASHEARAAFHAAVRSAMPDLLLLGGDIATGETVARELGALSDALPFPIAFVLGNHDCYDRSIRSTRETVSVLSASHPRLAYLPRAGVQRIGHDTAVIGVDGWADGRYGDYANSTAMVLDYRRIAELVNCSRAVRGAELMALGETEARTLSALLAAALADPRVRRVIVVTHVPPFEEAAWFEGRRASPDWTPHMTCRATGDVLRRVADAWPDREFLVLTGHTHHASDVHVAPNLRVVTAGATYEAPALQPLLVVP